MITSPQTIQVRRDGVAHTATISWRMDDRRWVVTLYSPVFELVEAGADDAFEALCLVRARLEPRGWRIGVAGAQPGVWPSGMARDQGGGLSAYRMSGQRVGEVVDTFEPVDPTTVATVSQQRAAYDSLFVGSTHPTNGTDDDPDVALPEEP